MPILICMHSHSYKYKYTSHFFVSELVFPSSIFSSLHQCVHFSSSKLHTVHTQVNTSNIVRVCDWFSLIFIQIHLSLYFFFIDIGICTNNEWLMYNRINRWQTTTEAKSISMVPLPPKIMRYSSLKSFCLYLIFVLILFSCSSIYL